MKNLKMSAKLIVSFLIVIAMAITVGVVGIIGMYNMNEADDRLYNGNYLPTVMAGDISQLIYEQRTHLRSLIIYDVNADADAFSKADNNLKQAMTDMDSKMSEYEKSIVNDDDREAYNELTKLYNNEWIPFVNEIQSLGRAGKTDESKTLLVSPGPVATAGKLDELTSRLQEINMNDGKTTVEGNTNLFQTMTIVNVGVLVFTVVVSLSLAFYISSLISKPLAALTAFMEKAGSTGDITLRTEEAEAINTFSQAKDELGRCVASTAAFIKRLTEVSKELEVIASGDLTEELPLLSNNDVMGISLKKMGDNLNNMFSEINNSTTQVSTGSKQIADGAQALAQGSTQQAAAVEQLSSSISEVAEKTKDNAEMANRASNLAETIKGNAEKGSRQMDTMMSAVKEINEASLSINKVIKVIDDIAFQTNILALNAAVEAARAGQHGKGFAVVAEEVRNLAAKSAAAAKDTGALIANSMEKAELGARIADETAASLTEIVSGINESTKIVSDIARSSEEQSTAISQINNGIDQVAQVVQQNSATAEESAAASEEMSSQSTMLEELIGQFKLKNQSKRALSPSPAPSKKQLVMPSKMSDMPSGDFGKY